MGQTLFRRVTFATSIDKLREVNTRDQANEEERARRLDLVTEPHGTMKRVIEQRRFERGHEDLQVYADTLP